MSATLNIAASGMQAQQFASEVIADNFANMQTTAKKRKRALFEDQVFEQIKRPGSSSSDSGTLTPSGVQRGLGVKIASTYRVNEQGAPESTGNPLDVMIQGDGYFHVSLPSGGSAYTRAGNLNLAPDGAIVNPQGYPVMPGIKIPVGAQVNIDPNGQVNVKIAGATDEKIIGTLEVVRFANESGLTELGSNLLQESESSGAPQIGTPGNNGFGTILQGHLEASNVNPIDEVMRLIKTQRGFQFISDVAKAEDEMQKQTATLAGR